ncbi:hypothetical protein HMPREF0973_01995 [Prevotella veroralis F0319]|uniref:Uncharacterized protein n=1 Tax=Prevotella veroralis F0319 TaxID=649761 RepID=C9MQU5_9BACT|nr:hypothetical protein HMPREF0973_01995 [Prevotella veroralis F0319]
MPLVKENIKKRWSFSGLAHYDKNPPTELRVNTRFSGTATERLVKDKDKI